MILAMFTARQSTWLGLAVAALFWGTFANAVQAQATPAEWTIMIYMAADNDLEGPALVDLDEIESGLPDSGVNVVVLIDRSSGYSTQLGDWHDSRILLMQPDRQEGHVDLQEIVHIGEVNTGDPKTLSDFIGFSINRFPAQRYGLILWDHGGGWQGMASDGDLGDGDGHDMLTTDELSMALRAGLPSGFKLDLIGFDMCLMAQLEVAYEVADFADFMVASQAIEPGYGWPYHFLLPEFGNKKATPRALAANIVKRYGEYADKEAEVIATQSAIDLKHIRRVRESLDALSTRLIAAAPEFWPNLSRSMFWADSFEVSGKAENLERGKDAVASSDLMDIVHRMRASLGQRFPAEAEYRRLLDAMDAAVVDNYTSRRHRLSHGLAVYAPPTGNNWNEAYLDLKIAKGSRWPGLLYAIHDQQQRHRNDPVQVKSMRFVKSGTKQEITENSMLDNATLKIEVEGDNLLWVTGLTTRYSKEQKGHLVYNTSYLADSRFMSEKLAASSSMAELLMPEFKGGSARMEMEIAPATFAITNGEVAAFASIDSRDAQSGAGSNIQVQAIYKSATEGEHLAVIAFDLRTWAASSIALLVEQGDGQVVPRGVEPKAEDQITLLYRFLPDDGDPVMLKGETMAWKNGLELIMDEVPNGVYTTFAYVENLSGQSASASASVNVVDARSDIRMLLDGARQLSVADLGGVWRYGDTQVFAIGKPLDGRGQEAQLIINKDVIPKDMHENLFVARLENRLLPTLHLVTYAKDGKTLLGREVYMVLADPTRPDMLYVKSLVGGEGEAVGRVMELRRTQLPGSSGSSASANDKNLKRLLIGAWEGEGPYGYIWVQMNANGQYHQIDTSFDGSGRMETRGVYRVDGNTMHMQAQQVQQCNAWGCQMVPPQPIPPFSFQTNGQEIQTQASYLYRVQ